LQIPSCTSEHIGERDANTLWPVLRIRIRIRMDPHDFGLLDPHPESAVQMRVPDADADPDEATQKLMPKF
jgi:hypothetical protein